MATRPFSSMSFENMLEKITLLMFFHPPNTLIIFQEPHIVTPICTLRPKDMQSCEPQIWRVNDLATAMNTKSSGKKKIVVPMFQRGKRWSKAQQRKFIDSLEKGYPVGTMLFYRSVDGEQEIYTLVDGLQRGNTIRSYIANPTAFHQCDAIPESILSELQSNINDICVHKITLEKIKSEINACISASDLMHGIQYYDFVIDFITRFETKEEADIQNVAKNIRNVIQPYLEGLKTKFDELSKATIPVVVYSGPIETLPEIFDRINSQGTPLKEYDVFAASWPMDSKFYVGNKHIVDNVIKKYNALQGEDFEVSGYDMVKIYKEQKLTAFEFVYGFSRYINDKYEMLKFHDKPEDDEIIPTGFELMTACFMNAKEDVRKLYEVVLRTDVNKFVKAIEEAIDFVDSIIAPISRFKANTHEKKHRKAHGKSQVISLISSVFRERFSLDSLTEKEGWDETKKLYQSYMLQHYIFDIISEEWHDGGNSLIFAINHNNKYIKPISYRVWDSMLNEFFEKGKANQELNKKTVGKSETVFLNAIYLSIFSAMDQLSIQKYDIEHIAPQDQLFKMMESTGTSKGLPINSVANLCYLPEAANRSKGAKNFYQDQKYLKHIPLAEVEEKYSFTNSDDLAWMDNLYENLEDFDRLKQDYMAFLNCRFKHQKEHFFSSLNILPDPAEDDLPGESSDSSLTGNAAVQSAINALSILLNKTFSQGKDSLWQSEDGSVGIMAHFSKKYKQGDKEKYWFSYRPQKELKVLKKYSKAFFLYVCGACKKSMLISREDLDSQKDFLRVSISPKDGNVDHYHIVLFNSKNGETTWMRSLPEVSFVPFEAVQFS